MEPAKEGLLPTVVRTCDCLLDLVEALFKFELAMLALLMFAEE